MMTKFAPASDFNSWAERFCVLPAMVVPTLSVPGLARAAARKSPCGLVPGRRVGDEDAVEIADARDRHEILERIERQVLEQRHADRGAVGQQRDGVAVGRRRKRGARCRDATDARHVLDHEALSELGAELFSDQPQRDVGDAAGNEWDDDANRTLGILNLRIDRPRQGDLGRNHRQGGDRDRELGSPGHLPSPFAALSTRKAASPPACRIDRRIVRVA